MTYSPLDMAKLKVLKEKDSLCAKCELSNEMLCNGYREYVNDESTQYYKRLVISTKPCKKRLELDRDERITAEILNAGFVDVDAVEQAVNADKAAVRLRFYDDMRKVKVPNYSEPFLVPRFANMEANAHNRLKSQCILYSAAESGYSIKYVDFNLLAMKSYDEQRKFLEENVDCDVVYIHGAHAKLGPEFYRNQVTSWVQSRVQDNRTTFVSLYPDVQTGYTDLEREYIEVVRSWSHLNLLSYI